MDFTKYLNNYYYDMLYEKYELKYLNSINEKNFNDIYKLLKKYNFYMIDDLIITYLELFESDPKTLETKIIAFINEQGKYYNVLLGNDISLIENLLN